jgi:hypothetical protein
MVGARAARAVPCSRAEYRPASVIAGACVPRSRATTAAAQFVILIEVIVMSTRFLLARPTVSPRAASALPTGVDAVRVRVHRNRCS